MLVFICTMLMSAADSCADAMQKCPIQHKSCGTDGGLVTVRINSLAHLGRKLLVLR